MSETPRPRTRLRLTLAAMMLGISLVAGGLGWIAHRARVQRRAVAAVVAAGGEVFYDWGWGEDRAKPPGPKWLRQAIGPEDFETVVGVNANTPAVDDAVVEQIGRLTRVRFLVLQGVTVTDEGLARLSGMHGLRTLHLRAAHVDGSGFRHLSGLTALDAVQLNETPITEENLEHVAAIRSITRLGFRNNRVGDSGMTTIATMPALRELWLTGTDVGDAGLLELAKPRRPLVVHVRGSSRITPEGIAAARRLSPEMTIVP